MTWILFFILFLIYLFNNFYWKRRHLPPGPIPLPIIGNMHEVAMSPPGLTPGSYEKWWDFGLEENLKQGGDYGVVETNGDLWKDQRRFTLTTFRNFGMGKNLMQEKILEEVVILISNLKENLEIDVNISQHIDVCIGSIINSILFGYRFDESNLSEFYQLKKRLSDNIRLVGNPLTIVAMSNVYTIGRLPYFRGLIKQSLENIHILFEFFDKQIEEHEKEINLDEDQEEPNDYCESYLREMNKGQAKSYFTKPQLRNMCLDLWAAGLETTANTVSWAILYLIHHSSVQKTICEELSKNIGTTRLITVNDKPKLSYINAFIAETQRLCNLLPQNLIRKTSKDVIIAGQKIAKGTSITPQISCVLYDEKIFPEHLQFKPERFIDQNGQFKKIDELIPFSIGKRQCLGESLARMELFLIIANLCNNFEIHSKDSSKLPTLKKNLGFTMNPQPFKCKLSLKREFVH